MTAQPVTVEQPKHPLHALTTYELRDYRRDLERAIGFFDRQSPVPAARDRLRVKLDDVIAEQDDRARLAIRSPGPGARSASEAATEPARYQAIEAANAWRMGTSISTRGRGSRRR